MSELIVIDQATGEEEELLCTGTIEELEQIRDQVQEDNQDAGGNWLTLRIQPAQ